MATVLQPRLLGGQSSFIIMTGNALEITESDVWMLRDWYRMMKPVRGW
jgi:hypothetical protein